MFYERLLLNWAKLLVEILFTESSFRFLSNGVKFFLTDFDWQKLTLSGIFYETNKDFPILFS